MYTKVKTESEIDAMRESGRMLASVRDHLVSITEPAMTGIDIDEIAQKELKKLGGKPAFLGYEGFPKTICISLNDEVVHGIPNDLPFEDGDIISYDFGVEYRGMITDSAVSFVLGKEDKKKQRLLNATEESMYAGIKAIKGKTPVGDISAAIQKVLDKYQYGIVRELVGHGVGHHVHEDPNIPNYGTKGEGPVLEPGMTIAIEPMATIGDYRVFVDSDKWTVKTQDGSLAAHFEHTVLITDTGSEILTRA